ncbi:MAG TPA: hypothetical protein DCE02_02330 [Ruminiclostridium sp.]|jgi:hypothetical protein|uniref:Uncharacterized protein n=1 Tax=Acetivibrio saccincola TaxID=1677857 RepID=A0A2K9EHI2_9FIRM|nr:hypothetical protein [Acetivibrio saccincola]HAA42830.1 hypothetical protein [Ruminiclostridium sp.]AUG57403.1 hypothetical protein HVS_07440 [Acetivibrio saccincola]NLW26597.1 hypothetical protein [Acetivibrio saccincola]PQQ67329.1 hypothetical protein B9R14_11600 [Acetivibrio saccincola]HOA96196.1 hypothetical protein [Acetivibrio saccincola]
MSSERGPRIEAGQILNPSCFPPPNELVCIQVPKVFDQVALRDCITRTVVLKKGGDVCHPSFTFEGATDFTIVEVKVISKTDSLTKPGYKKLKLFVKIRYTIHYSDGSEQLEQVDEAAFNLTVNEIYCPNCISQSGSAKTCDNFWDDGRKKKKREAEGSIIKVEALAEAFNDMLNQATGMLTIDIGVFFIVKCECVVQLLIPSYGYCPVPPEQNVTHSQNCKTFVDRKKTPFPTRFFPEQKWNPLDQKREYSED